MKKIIQPTYPLVLLLGAGASKGALEESRPGPPIDLDFFDVANSLKGHGTSPISKRVLRSVWELYSKTSGVGLEEYYRDIETRAAISEFAKAANKPKDWKKRKANLEELIRRVYIQTTVNLAAQPPKPKESLAHKAIWGFLKSGSTIITFNYDLVIEESFDNASLWNPKDGYGTNVHGTTLDWCRHWCEDRNYKKGTKSKVHLLKLHGSLGWTLYKNREIRLKARPYTVQKNRVEKISVLPPGYNKKINVNPYKIFWREARLKLDKCKSLMIVGYSLPETDLLAKSLFAEVVRLRAFRKKYIDRLIVVDPSDVVHERFVKLFTPALGPLGKIVRLNSITDLIHDQGARVVGK
jgi:hypothetical protein